MLIREARLVYDTIRYGKSEPLDSPERVVGYLEGTFDAYPTQESLWVILMNHKNVPLGRNLVSLGTLSNSLAHPREIYKAAIVQSSSSIILAHNHPSGDPMPSSSDCNLTKRIYEAGEIVGIGLLDHIIVGDQGSDPLQQGYYSFKASGLL